MTAPRRTPRRRTRRTAEDDIHVQLAARLTARDRWVIRMLAEHRVLTTIQLDQLAFTGPRQHTTPRTTQTTPVRSAAKSGPRAAQSRLRTLAELGVIDRFRLPTATGTGSTGHHWVTTPLSFTVLAAEDGNPQPAPRRPAASHGSPTASPTTQPDRALPGARGVALAHNQQLAHQLGTNACLVALTTAQPHPHLQDGRPVGQVRLWWGQARAGRHLSPARPDAYALWTDTPTPSQPAPARTPPPATTPPAAALAFALEYDTGTETLHQVAGKLADYHALALATTITTPVLFWLPTPRRETNLRAALTDALAALPAPRLIPIATAYPHPELPGAGWHPHAPIWAPLTLTTPAMPHRPHPHPLPGHHPRPRPGGTRLSLAQLAAALGEPTRAHHDRVHRIDAALGHHHTKRPDAIGITPPVHAPGHTGRHLQDSASGPDTDGHRHTGDSTDPASSSLPRTFSPSAPWRAPSPIAPPPADTRFPHTTPPGR